jgi:hypothetical protein
MSQPNNQLSDITNKPQSLSLLKGDIDLRELQTLGDVFFK